MEKTHFRFNRVWLVCYHPRYFLTKLSVRHTSDNSSCPRSRLSLFCRHVLARPNSVVVFDDKLALTYSQLEAWSDLFRTAIVAQLRTYHSEAVVAVCFPRSTILLVSVLALAKAGLFYCCSRPGSLAGPQLSPQAAPTEQRPSSSSQTRLLILTLPVPLPAFSMLKPWLLGLKIYPNHLNTMPLALSPLQRARMLCSPSYSLAEPRAIPRVS